jgi:hypothetical protein
MIDAVYCKLLKSQEANTNVCPFFEKKMYKGYIEWRGFGANQIGPAKVVILGEAEDEVPLVD